MSKLQPPSGSGEGNPESKRTDFKRLRERADHGDVEAQVELGKAYSDGEFAGRDPVEAVRWYRKAAEVGNPTAQCHLADCFYIGVGVEKSPREAVAWYRKAAAQGFALAQVRLGFCLDHGIGTERRPGEAVQWYRKAAELGHPMGQNNLGHCYSLGESVPKNDKEAVSWYKKAAEQGEPLAQFNLATALHSGVGIPRDHVEAYKWYALAIESTLKEPQAFQNSIKGEVDLGKEANKWLSTLARDMTASQILEAKQRIKAFAPRKSDAEPSTESATEILLDDPSKMLDVRIHRILVGQRVVDDGRYWQHQLDEVQKQGKELIYFDVSVKNLGRLGEHQFWHLSFALEDSDGNSYSCDQTVDYLRGTVHQGKIGRGGIAFAVYQNHRPKSLVYDTGMTVGVSRQKVFARTDELQSLPIFAGSNRASLTVPLRIP